jgi:anthranilate synthase component 2
LHGKVSPVTHTGHPLFAGVPSPFTAARYHSLAVRRADLPPELEVIAETEDGEIMALAHRARPWFGLQFHPESVGTPDGKVMLANFVALARAGAHR